MSTLRFLHAADLHLGRQFSGLVRIPDHVRSIFRRAGYDAWTRMIDTAVHESVDFVVLAGDVFHDANPPIPARVAFVRGLEILSESGISVYLALGNHDPLRSFPDALRSAPGLHVFPADPQSLSWKGVEFDSGVVISGASFERSAVTENLVRGFTRDSGIDMAIGVVHTNVSGSKGHRDYAPCTLDDLLATGMDAWCLGHVHSARILRQDPLILYAGTSQGAHALETGTKGSWLVTLPERGSASTQFVSLAPVLWQTAEVCITSATASEDVLPLVEEACLRLITDNEGLKALALGIRLTGEQGEWHSTCLSEHGELREMLSERLSELAVPVCLASLSDETRSAADMAALAAQEGFLGDLLRFCLDAGNDPLATHDIRQAMRKELVRKVSPGLLDPLLESLLDSSEDAQTTDVFRAAAALAASTFFDISNRKA